MAPCRLLCHFIEGSGQNVIPVYECPIDQGGAAHFSLGEVRNEQ